MKPKASNPRLVTRRSAPIGPLRLDSIVSTGTLATWFGVAGRTAVKWLDAGVLKSFRLPCSQDRRVIVADAIDFARKGGMPIPAELRHLTDRVARLACCLADEERRHLPPEFVDLESLVRVAVDAPTAAVVVIGTVAPWTDALTTARILSQLDPGPGLVVVCIPPDRSPPAAGIAGVRFVVDPAELRTVDGPTVLERTLCEGRR